jgi:hypothetical protein
MLSFESRMKRRPIAHKDIPLAVPALGGYCLSSTVNLGAHRHHSVSGMTSITLGTCRPHPNQEDLAVIGLVEDVGAGDLDGQWGESLQQVGQVCGLHILTVFLQLKGKMYWCLRLIVVPWSRRRFAIARLVLNYLGLGSNLRSLQYGNASSLLFIIPAPHHYCIHFENGSHEPAAHFLGHNLMLFSFTRTWNIA